MSALGLLAWFGGPPDERWWVILIALSFLVPPIVLFAVLGLSLWAWITTRRRPDGATRRSWKPLGLAGVAMLLSVPLWVYLSRSGSEPARDKLAGMVLQDTRFAVSAQLDRWQEEAPRLPAPQLEARLAALLRAEAARQGITSSRVGLSLDVHRVEGAGDPAAMDIRVRALAVRPGWVVVALQASAPDRPGFVAYAVRFSDPKRSPEVISKLDRFEFPFGAR